jgi:hypothetical protein
MGWMDEVILWLDAAVDGRENIKIGVTKAEHVPIFCC